VGLVAMGKAFGLDGPKWHQPAARLSRPRSHLAQGVEEHGLEPIRN